MGYEPPAARRPSSNVCIAEAVERFEGECEGGESEDYTAIEAAEDAPASAPPPASVEQRRHEYRQLFSRLRRS